MPHKFNTSRRHKFAKKKYRVTNWCGYNESLRNRGDLTVWITGDARKHWAAPRRRSRGGQPRYSDLAITMCLTLGMVYRGVVARIGCQVLTQAFATTTDMLNAA